MLSHANVCPYFIVESLLEFLEKYRARLKPTPMTTLYFILYQLVMTITTIRV